ncbi:hypothetical protein CEXT_322921 [Caerostris extrusa]|uniref:Uncharacterized protein n=1 Tax=Caerostris extrusa TaxID=172846 RepID=A0AAV4NI21_CAEEX|nr:hypothetical protein CEXT_322921 [Caerostris extrusa]
MHKNAFRTGQPRYSSQSRHRYISLWGPSVSQTSKNDQPMTLTNVPYQVDGPLGSRHKQDLLGSKDVPRGSFCVRSTLQWGLPVTSK